MLPGEAYSVGLTSGGCVYGEMGERSKWVYDESGDGSGVLQIRWEAEDLRGDLDDDLLDEDLRLILILEIIRNKTN